MSGMNLQISGLEIVIIVGATYAAIFKADKHLYNYFSSGKKYDSYIDYAKNNSLFKWFPDVTWGDFYNSSKQVTLVVSSALSLGSELACDVVYKTVEIVSDCSKLACNSATILANGICSKAEEKYHDISDYFHKSNEPITMHNNSNIHEVKYDPIVIGSPEFVIKFTGLDFIDHSSF